MSLFPSLRDTSGPTVAVELSANRVSAASLTWRGGEPAIAAHALEPLAPGMLTPSLTSTNIHDRAAVGMALQRVLERVGHPRRIGLVVPDLVAKVSLVRFEQVPSRAADLDQLVRWQMRKTAPFPIDDAPMTYVPGLHHPDGQEFIVSIAKRDVVQEYESIVDEAGAHAGIVDISTFNVINAVLAARGPQTSPPAGDWLLVNVAPDYASIAILRGPHPIFFRNRAADSDGTLEDLVHQTAMYYEDRLKGGAFTRVLLAGAAAASPDRVRDFDEMRRTMEQRLNIAVDAVDPRSAAGLTDRIAAAPALLDALAPLVGLLLRDREAA